MNILKLHPNAITPSYAHQSDACFDLHACTVAGMTETGLHVLPRHPLVCGTGLAFEIPEGFVMLVFSRSGHGFKSDVRLANCVGVIDSGYVGEVMVKLTCDDNVALEDWRQKRFYVQPGDRIAQAMIISTGGRWDFEVVEQLSLTERGSNGFGSSGQ